MQMITVKLLGKEVQAELLNPDVTKSYEDGFNRCIERISAATDAETGSQGIREQCQAVIDYVSDIFGEEAARDVFGEQTDLLTCMDALEQMLDMYEEQVNPIIKEKTKILKEKLKQKGTSDA